MVVFVVGDGVFVVVAFCGGGSNFLAAVSVVVMVVFGFMWIIIIL